VSSIAPVEVEPLGAALLGDELSAGAVLLGVEVLGEDMLPLEGDCVLVESLGIAVEPAGDDGVPAVEPGVVLAPGVVLPVEPGVVAAGDVDGAADVSAGGRAGSVVCALTSAIVPTSALAAAAVAIS
jgi:hypothetical protein